MAQYNDKEIFKKDWLDRNGINMKHTSLNWLPILPKLESSLAESFCSSNKGLVTTRDPGAK